MPPPQASVIWTLAMETFHAKGLNYPRATTKCAPIFLTTRRFVTIFPASVLGLLKMRSDIQILPVEELHLQPRRPTLH
jgi:hypothetical protein